jgi:pilus assembly protein CpaE
MLAGVVAVHRSKVQVLAQPQELVELELIRGDDILRMLTVVADAYQYVLVDCGVRLDEATLTTNTIADMVLLVTRPDVPAVRNAWRRLKLMDQLGIDRSVVRLIVNGWDSKAALTREDIERNLGMEIAATIALDPDVCRKAVNTGDLLQDVDRKSPALRDIGAAVSLLTEGVKKVESDATQSARKSFWPFK